MSPRQILNLSLFVFGLVSIVTPVSHHLMSHMVELTESSFLLRILIGIVLAFKFPLNAQVFFIPPVPFLRVLTDLPGFAGHLIFSDETSDSRFLFVF